MSILQRSTIALLLALAAQGAVFAADRALLIGVSQPALPIAERLPGIQLDLAMMREVAGLLGFAPDTIRELHDEAATHAAVRTVFHEWLIDDMEPQDRVMLYFSGHGARIPDENGDEDDGLDEVLALFDTHPVRRNGITTLDNVLVDDQLGIWLERISSRNLLVIIDACHSGTITRTLVGSHDRLEHTTGITKFLTWPDMPHSSREAFRTVDREPPYILLTATHDGQDAIATEQGSLFTLGLYETVRTAARLGRPLTPLHLHQGIAAYVRANLAGRTAFQPRLAGAASLRRKPLSIAALNKGYGPNWNTLSRIATSGHPLRMRLNQENYREGDSLTITVNIPEPGYLNVINVASDDRATLLFPNAHHTNNRVEPGQFRLPSPRMPFELVATRPHGPSLVVAFLSRKPLNLYHNGFHLPNARGQPLDLRELSVQGKATMQDAADQAGSWSARTVVQVCGVRCP